LFKDRAQAGRRLAYQLGKFAGRPDAVVLGLARGGIPVAFEVARILAAPLDIFMVRKLSLPQYPETAIGAVASGGLRVINREIADALGVTAEEVGAIAAARTEELRRREKAYRGSRPAATVKDKTVILVDDGLATGASMLAAVRAVRRLGAQKTVVAVPVSSSETCDFLREEADEVICLETPAPFLAVGIWYENFSQVSDEEARSLLERALKPAEVR